MPAGPLAAAPGVAHTPLMVMASTRLMLLLAGLVAALALGIAHLSEYLGLVPCALCLVERWPYRVLILLALAGLALPPALRRAALAAMALAALAAAAAGFVHVGVEQGWWPSPLPECVAPNLGGGSIAERLARMPLKPSKPCDEPTYLVAFLPVSMAAMNMLLGLAFAATLATCVWQTRRSGP